MNWVTRAKETILGASNASSASRQQVLSPSTPWHELRALKPAINEATTGATTLDPLVQFLTDTPCSGAILVLAPTAAEADQIAGIVRALASGAQVSAAGIETDRATPARPFDLAVVCLSHAIDRDADDLFSWLGAALGESGQLWLNLREAPADPVHSRSQATLLDDMLRQVPRRWRLKEHAVPAIQPPHATPGAAQAALQANFEITSQKSRGGTLLGPLLATGCIAPEIDEDEEGRAVLLALYRVEAALIAGGQVPGTDWIIRAKPRPASPDRVRALFDEYAGALPAEALAGMSGPLPAWIKFNTTGALKSARAADWAAPFPPRDLMYHTTGLVNDRDFAQHGADILNALAAASPAPLNGFGAVLDFGVGVGRVARYFKGFSGRYVGVDIDQANLDWVAGSMPWVEGVTTEPGKPFPFADATFDAVISISVFTHIDRAATEFYIEELHRVTRPGALLFLTLHGERALTRALTDETVGKLVGVPVERLEQTKATLAESGFDFAEQYTHLTRRDYRYGITFASQAGAESLFGTRFKVHGFVPGAIHNFQDLIVLEHL